MRKDNLTVTGIKCDKSNNYFGSVSISACSGDETSYNLSGCIHVSMCKSQKIWAYYNLQTNSECSTSISTSKECEAAAKQLNLYDQTVDLDGRDGVSFFPKGCYVMSYNYLKFNSKMTNTGSCAKSHYGCLCRERPYGYNFSNVVYVL